MAGKHSSVNPVTNDDTSTKTNMMDMWRQSIERAQKNRSAAQGVMREENNSRTDLEQRIRNGQAQCPTCSSRQYADQSDDGGVSFQAARHISAATAGVVVMNHENEHVSAEESKSDAESGVVKDSTVALEYGKCPECGKTYVKGGVTKTTTRAASSAKLAFAGKLDTEV